MSEKTQPAKFLRITLMKSGIGYTKRHKIEVVSATWGGLKLWQMVPVRAAWCSNLRLRA